MEQEIESIGSKSNDDPPRGVSDQISPEKIIDKIDPPITDEATDVGKACENDDKDSNAINTVDSKIDEDSSSNATSSEIQEIDKSPEKDVLCTETAETSNKVVRTEVDNLGPDEEKTENPSNEEPQVFTERRKLLDSEEEITGVPEEENVADKATEETAEDRLSDEGDDKSNEEGDDVLNKEADNKLTDEAANKVSEEADDKISEEPQDKLSEETEDKLSEETEDKIPEETEDALPEETVAANPTDQVLVKKIPEKPTDDGAAEFLHTEESSESKLPDSENVPDIIDCPESENKKSIDDTSELPHPGESPESKFSDLENPPDIIDRPESERKKSSDDAKSDSEVISLDTDSHNKEITLEKQIVEPENTEFVQITQDKQDDAQNEGQTIEAEDPFGGDNLIPDNVEQITNVDSPTTDDMNFRKLGDQAVNLQDVVNAKDTNYKDQISSEFATEDSNLEDAIETNIESVNRTGRNVEISLESNIENLETREDSPSKSKTDEMLEEKSPIEKSPPEPMSVDNEDDTIDDEAKKKNDNEEQPMETEDSQSNVLPGQDDELCIIPDSMKESTTSRVTTSDDAEKIQTFDVEMEKSLEKEQDKDQTKEMEIIANDKNELSQVEVATFDKERKKPEKLSSEKKSVPATDTDVIDIDEEMKNSELDEFTNDEICKQCNERKSCSIIVKLGAETFNVCSQSCKIAFTDENNKSMDIPSDGVNSKRDKRCASCLLIVETGDERNLSWETMEFCNEECLGKFQTKYGSYCRNCNGSVQPISLGKYCVRFGYDVRQFCCSSCLEEFKKGLKVCSYCQKDISSGTEGFLAPVGDKGQFKDFCTQYCMEKYSHMNSNEPPSAEKKSCSVCQEVKVVHCEVQIDRATPVAICSDPCFAAFKFVNKVDPEQCSTCKKFFELATKKSFVVFYDNEAHTFCNKTCLNIFIITNRKIVPCNWCKVKKYNFDMIRKDLKTGQSLMMCSLNCLTLYQVSVNAVSAKRISCDFCKEFSQAQYHLTMSDATIRNFCSYDCVMKFQSQYTKSPITIPSSDDPVPTGMPKRTYPPAKGTYPAGSLQTVPIQAVQMQKTNEIGSKKTMPVISSVTSLATLGSNGQVSQASQQSTINSANVVAASVTTTQSQTPQVIVNQQVITRPPSPVKIHNKMTQCKPLMHTKGVSVRPHPCLKSTQTEGEARVLIPIPVPIYVPFPVHMWSMPFPVPVPFPLPIPVPIFIPTTRNSAKGIFKDIKRIQDKIPADPFEAELLMMAEMVATEKKANESDSDSSDDNGRDTAEPVDSSNTFGEDMLQMALKMATGELDEPAVDLETALTPNTITATQTTSQTESSMDTDVQPERNVTTSTRGKKRMVPYKPRGAPSKRGRRVSGVHDVPMMPPPEPQPPPQARMIEPIEKPDANMALKYTFGVNAWRQWVIAKNAELEKQVTPPRKVKLFKTDLLQLTADELNYTLCLFVKEVRKPNGAEYAPDTIYYLCLGIQQYLFENNRIDNIFTDSYYEKFTDCLNDVAKKFSVLYNDAQYIVTRVEEEHLWECKQLGAHSPHVLLSTLMFFNTKHFNLVTVEEHMQLSFSHIMKHWKRNPAAQAAAVAGKVPSTRNVLLRFYPPQSALEANSRKKKVYEQQENEENPLRCPVKLYEFYLSKCPESVKTRNDVFYLLPERSCVPDSPVWYSTSALAKEHLVKMLYRVKMVKEINVALLTS